jgi:hypothetical protein
MSGKQEGGKRPSVRMHDHQAKRVRAWTKRCPRRFAAGVDWLFAATVLAWLAGVAALAATVALWVTVLVALLALQLGIWRRSDRKRLVVVAGLPVVAVLALAVAVGTAGHDNSRCVPSAGAPSHCFPADYTGPVWVELAAAASPAQAHVTVRWGPKQRVADLQLGQRPTYLVMTKLGTDSVPVQVTVAPAVAVHFGQGRPPSHARTVMLDSGWTSVS